MLFPLHFHSVMVSCSRGCGLRLTQIHPMLGLLGSCYIVCAPPSLHGMYPSDAQVYCVEGSSVPAVAQLGEYTVGPTPSTRNGTAPCPSGFYCTNGVAHPCPAGRFGCATRLGDPACNGPCTAGFFCAAGSATSQASVCGGNASDPAAPGFFCPAGSGAPLVVGLGNFSVGSGPEEPHRRTGQAACSPGTYCSGGVQVSGGWVTSFCWSIRVGQVSLHNAGVKCTRVS